jgi:2',3'-cyclic-nucleotide 2'-phosphodiesterase/3'-nucleotidase
LRSFLARAAVALALLLAGSRLSAATVTLLHTSDLHGRVHPRDTLGDADFGEGLARVAAAVARIRAEGRPTLLLDSGDTIQGSPEQALVFGGKVGDGSDPIVRAMNRLGYDAMAVGNHEFDFGRERLEASRREARFPFLAANIVREKGLPAFTPYLVREIGGVRVGILGLTTRNVASWEPASHVEGLRFLDSVETARRYVPELRGRRRCDLVVVLAHQGFERDPATGEDRGSSEENQAYALATEVPGIDLLLTGHTHTVIEPRRLGAAWVSQPGRFGNTLTRFDVRLSRRGSRWVVTSVSGKNLPMKQVPPDPALVADAAEHEATMRVLAAPVASLATPLSAAGARTSDTALLDWLHAVQRREGRAELSFASLLPGALAPWREGPLTLRQIWSFYPYENTLVTVRATGRQIREALERSARCVSGVAAAEDGKLVWRRNPAVWGYNCDTMDGADYALDPTRPEGNRLLFLRRDGRPIADDELVTVALNSYRAAGGGGFGVWRNCPRVSERAHSLRELLVEDARRQGVVRVESNGNWFLAPSLPEGRP